jgi:curli biogenesis system outer membrane secretion channel CsgG
MKSSIRSASASFCGTGLIGWLTIAALACASNAFAQSSRASEKEPVVLVATFENQSKAHPKISYEVGTGNKEGHPKRSFIVDRFTEAPRSILEDMLSNMKGIRIVERQRVDSVLMETEFGAMSGLVDPEKAVKLGKMLGANMIVMGTIIEIRDDHREFTGYGVKSKVNKVVCQIRVRLLDIESGAISFSKIVEGAKTYTESTYGKSDSGTKDGYDRDFAAIEDALDRLRDDAEFKAALFGKNAGGRDAAKTDGLVEVEFAPKPDNCDIEIDGKYVGGSPLKRRLPAGKDVKVKIAKGGFQQWEGVIVPEAGLKVTRELGTSH